MVKYSLIVPAYNEETRIRPFLEAYRSHFGEREAGFMELVVVPNGCTDRTREVVESFLPRFPMLRVIDIPETVGKGGAVIRGFREARGERIGFVDADGATPPETMEALFRELDDGRTDAAIASRWLAASDIDPPQPRARRLASRLFNGVARLLFGLRVTDTQCGAKVFTRQAVHTVLPRLGITRWAFDVDLLFQLRRAGFCIREVPTVWHDVSGSKVRIVRSSLEMLVAMARLRLIYSPFRWVVTLYDCTLGRFFQPAASPRKCLPRKAERP